MNEQLYGLPELALSVRQPWAWAIVHAGKNIENRSWQAVNHGLNVRGPICIHASKGMAKYEYEGAREMMAKIGVECPPPHKLQRGGIIGHVKVVGVVREHTSPWFVGPRGLVLEDASPCMFIASVGQLGFFKWQGADESVVPSPARWMLPGGMTHVEAEPPF